MKRGRDEKKVYLYNENGDFLLCFDNSTVFCNTNQFDKNKMSVNCGVFIFEDRRVASWNKIGRIGVRKVLRYKDSEFVGAGKSIAYKHLKKSKKGNVIFTDLDGLVVAVFDSVFQAQKLTGFSTIHHIKAGQSIMHRASGLKITVEKLT